MDLKIEVQPIDGVKRRLCVEVDVAEVTREFDRAYADMGRTMNVPGFRRGRVPRSVLERRYGSQISADVFDRLIRASLVEAIERESLPAIGHPHVTTQNASQGEPLRYEATVEVPPQIQLGQYTGLRVERPVEEISEEDVERSISALRESLAQLLPIEDRQQVEAGDVAMVDYEVRRGDQVLGHGENRQVTIGSNSLPPEFDQHLIGAELGQTLEFDAVDRPSEEEAREPQPPMHFRVTPRSLLRKELPPLDDEFAKDHGECESLEALRSRVRQRLEEESQARADQAARGALLAQLVELHEFDVPDVMLENRLESLVEDVLRDWQWRKVAPRDARAAIEQLREELKPRARHQVKLSLLLEAIARQENLEISDEAIDAELEQIAAQSQQPIEKVQAAYGSPEARNYFRRRLLEQKASALVAERAAFETVVRSGVADTD